MVPESSRSLAARWTVAAGLLLALAVAAHVAVAVLMVRAWAADVAQGLVQRARTAQALIERLPAAQRAAWSQANDLGVRRSTHDGPTATCAAPLRDWLAAALLAQLHEAGSARMTAGADCRIPGPMVLQIDFEVDGTRWRVRHESAPSGAAAALAGWVLLAGLAFLAARRFGRRWIAAPLRRLAADIAGPDDAQACSPAAERLPAEVRAVAQAVDARLDRLRQAKQLRLRQWAELRHDVSMPLARLRLRAETRCDAATARETAADVAAVRRLVDGVTGAAADEPAPVAETVRAVVAGYVSAGHDVAVEIAATAMGRAPRLAMERLLGNLVDNALTHGVPPVRVSLTAAMRDRSAVGTLAVFDSGAGPDGSAGCGRLKDDGVEAATAADPGGLGLIIVSRIAAELDGRVATIRPPEGGFGVCLHWPLRDLM